MLYIYISNKIMIQLYKFYLFFFLLNIVLLLKQFFFFFVLHLCFVTCSLFNLNPISLLTISILSFLSLFGLKWLLVNRFAVYRNKNFFKFFSLYFFFFKICPVIILHRVLKFKIYISKRNS